MSRSMQRIRHGVFGMVMAGALGFGATQALAAPETRPAQQVPRCDSAFCDRVCKLAGAPGGFCSRGSCFCYR